MPARIVDISDRSVTLPEFLIVDSSLLLEVAGPPSSSRPERAIATSFLQKASSEALRGNMLLIVPLLVMEECLFKIIQWRYEAVLSSSAPGRKTRWHDDGYKVNPSLIQ